MVKWIKINKHMWFGLFGLGFAFLFMQELPYIIMPFIKLSSNPLMEMINAYPILEILEKVFIIGVIISMILIVDDDSKWFSVSSLKEKVFFSISILLLLGYYIGWIFYFNGYQSLPLVLILLVSLPPLYYTFIGLWRKNNVMAVLGGLSLFVHIANVWTSYGG